MVRANVMELVETEVRERRRWVFEEEARCKVREVLGAEVRSWTFVALPKATLRSV